MFIPTNLNASSNMNNSSFGSNLNVNSTNHLNSFGQDYSTHQSAMAASGLASHHHHHFASHYSHPQPSIYTSNIQSFSNQPNQFSSLNRYQNHTGLHSPFASNQFHLNLSKSNFEHSFSNSLSSGTLAGQTLLPNDSCNSSGSSSSPNSSASSTSPSPTDSKFNFLPQSNYLSNYRNSNSAFSSQSSIQHQLHSNNSALHPSLQHPYSSFNPTRDVKPFCNQFNNALNPYDDEDLREEEDDDLSISHVDMKTVMQFSNSGLLLNGSSNEPLPGKTRTREKYRSVYSELQRHELENEFSNNKYVVQKRKTELAQKLSLTERQIKIWFQNRRAKDRRGQSRKSMEQYCQKYGIPNVENII